MCTFYSAAPRCCTVSGHYYLSAGSETLMVVVAEDRTDGPHLLVVTVDVVASDFDEEAVDVSPVPADYGQSDYSDQQQPA